MAKVVSFINLKGGVGKTTLALAIGEFLAFHFQKRVLLVDLDHQTNLSVAVCKGNALAKYMDEGRTIYPHLKPLYLISELESPSRDYKPYSDLRQKYYVRGQQPKNPSGRYKIEYIWTEGTKTYELYNRIERLTEEFMERCR